MSSPILKAKAVLESPFGGDKTFRETLTVPYTRLCMLDMLSRGEAPLASHLLYPQVLDDDVPVERDFAVRSHEYSSPTISVGSVRMARTFGSDDYLPNCADKHSPPGFKTPFLNRKVRDHYDWQEVKSEWIAHYDSIRNAYVTTA